MACSCEICKDISSWTDAIKSDDVKARLEIFSELFERLETAETDVTYFRSIMDGSWPQSEHILQRALTRVQTLNKNNADLEAAQLKHGIIK